MSRLHVLRKLVVGDPNLNMQLALTAYNKCCLITMPSEVRVMGI